MLINCFCEDMAIHPAELIEAVQKEKGKSKSNLEQVRTIRCCTDLNEISSCKLSIKENRFAESSRGTKEK